jgi:hypothetical protein
MVAKPKVSLEGVITWPLRIVTVAVGQTVEAAMATAEIEPPV